MHVYYFSTINLGIYLIKYLGYQLPKFAVELVTFWQNNIIYRKSNL